MLVYSFLSCSPRFNPNHKGSLFFQDTYKSITHACESASPRLRGELRLGTKGSLSHKMKSLKPNKLRIMICITWIMYSKRKELWAAALFCSGFGEKISEERKDNVWSDASLPLKLWWGPGAWASPESLQEIQVLGPTLDLLNENPQEQNPWEDLLGQVSEALVKDSHGISNQHEMYRCGPMLSIYPHF